MTKLAVALALLLSATSVSLAQSAQQSRPGPYFGNDYGPNGIAQASPDGGAASQR
jgi:hypothetical protein